MTYIEVGLKVIKILNDKGYTSFIVGGAVRDYLLNRPINDVDIATSANPEIVKDIFGCKDVDSNYNCVVVEYEGYSFEITTFRHDLEYIDNRHPVFEKADNFEQDVVRRDFTVNALGLDCDMKVVDLVGGLEDLDNHVIKAIGNPEIRFQEDSLRILRAIYFASKLNFIIDSDTLKAIKKEAYLLQNLSYERIYEELKKIVNTKNYLYGFNLIRQNNVDLYLPDFKDGIDYVLKHRSKDIDFLLFLLLSYYKKDLKNVGIPEKKRISHIYELLEQKLTDPVVHFSSNFEDIVYANELSILLKKKHYSYDRLVSINKELAISDIRELKIKGNQIMELTKLNGEIIGQIINELISLVLNRKLENNYDALSSYVIKKYNR